MRDSAEFLARLWRMEAGLVASGLEPLPEWWRDTLERFYRSGKRRLVVRKGRRVFASTSVAPRLAVAEMLFGGHPHVTGTPPLIYAFLSVKRGEAAGRLAGISAILDALNIPYEAAGQTVRVIGRPAVFEVITASFRASVGGTVAFAWCDEVSRWNDDKLSRNPAEQVITSLAPALATLPDAKLFLVSSPLSTKDFHAKAFDDGETEQQCVAFGETWVINPTLTEEATHALEPNVRAWTREYAAQPVDGVEEDWFGTAVAMAFPENDVLVRPFGVGRGQKPVITIDPAFARHYFGFAVTTSEPAYADPTRRLTIVHESGAWEPNGKPSESLERLRDSIIRPTLAKAERKSEQCLVYTDQAEFHSLKDLARSLGITLMCVPWTGGDGETGKRARYRAVRAAMWSDEVRIQSHFSSPERQARLIDQFRSVVGVVLPSGNEQIRLREDGSGHCDELSAVVQGISIALELPPVAALPEGPLVENDGPAKWRADALKEMQKRREKEWNRSPVWSMRKAMGLR